KLTSNLPGIRIQVLSIPDWFGLWQNLHGNSSATAAWTGYGRCPDLLGSSATASDRQAVADRITALNQAIVSVCQQYTNCGTDGGAIYRPWSTLPPSNLTFDYFHLSEAGQALVAASSWNAGLFVAPSNSTAPVIMGTAQQGQTLSVSNGSWTGSPTSFAYAWKDCDSGGGNC